MEMHGCRWCSEDFQDMDLLYLHARSAHPHQYAAAVMRPERGSPFPPGIYRVTIPEEEIYDGRRGEAD